MSSWLLKNSVPIISSPLSKLANIVLSTVAETTSKRNMDKTLAKYFVVVVSYARKYFCSSQIQHEDKTNAKTKKKKEREKWSLTLLQDVGDSLAMWVYLVLKYNDSFFFHLH